MSEYNYSNELERERTQKYEGTYTSEEIELNKKLLEECDKKIIDYTVVEELLKQGADPLGGTGIYGWDLVGHVIVDIWSALKISARIFLINFIKQGEIEK